ncbi:hypothetical protein ACH41E_27220 [Streptomyces sp. NPDC020412]|uniref:DUF7544 domain-containing protein n=1 Tax=Streptomyces sp. NPDC020412 TaxID=3365073 RepID=UPI0037A04F48
MNDTPGWASPGSAPSEGRGQGQDEGQGAQVPRPAEPVDQTGPASNWSSKQPPAGQWSAPPPPQPGPGWGGPQHHGGWGAPPAAKPGVIPLRPLSVGEILDGAVSTLRTHWRTVLGITITVSVIAEIGNILITRYLMPEPLEIDSDADGEEALRQAVDSLQSTMLSTIPMMIIGLIATLFTTALLTMVISRSVLGKPVTIAEAWQEARPRLPQLLAVTLLLPLIAAAIVTVAALPGMALGGAGGAALAVLGIIAALPVAIWLMVRFTLAPSALMLERQGVFAAMRRSAKLVSGSWWRTFGIVVLTTLLSLIVSMIIAIPFSVAALATDDSGVSGFVSGDIPDYSWMYLIITGIGAVIASSITYPITAGVYVLLYIDQRIRREALDIELGRAAGLPGYGTESPPGATTGSQ